MLDGDSIVGVLNIARCLYDAITRMEKASGNSQNAVNEMVKKDGDGGQRAAGGDDVEAPREGVWGGVDAQGNARRRRGERPAQRVLHRGGRDGAEGAALIAKTKRAVLAVEGGEVVGILTPKDLLTRVLAKDLSPDECVVGEIMTAHPETAEPDVTLIDALHMMHTGRFLHLPVVAADSTVFGVIDVKELAYSTMGGDGKDGWKNLFDLRWIDEDSNSESGSKGSRSHSQAAPPSRVAEPAPTRTVARMRPDQPLVLEASSSVAEVSKAMTAKRVACALLVQEDGLAGIITDHDIARKVVAPSLDPETTRALDVATVDPQCVSVDDSAIEALDDDGRTQVRHLPVLDGDSIVGVLNIARCLYDAITRMEKAQAASGDNQNAVNEMMKQMATTGNAQQAAMMSKLLQPMLEKAFGAASTLKGLLDADEASGQRSECCIEAGATVREAAALIAKTKRAVLAVEGGEVVGILTPKDLLTRVLAKDLSPDECVVSEIMTSHPETAEPDVTLVDALHTMHTGRFLHLPVVAADSTVFGVIDVKELVYSTMGGDGKDGWKSLFDSAFEEDSNSETGSKGSQSRAQRQELDRARRRARPTRSPRGRSRGCGPTSRSCSRRLRAWPRCPRR